MLYFNLILLFLDLQSDRSAHVYRDNDLVDYAVMLTPQRSNEVIVGAR